MSISLRREHLFAPRSFTSLMVNQELLDGLHGHDVERFLTTLRIA
jgi:hypothetical protein